MAMVGVPLKPPMSIGVQRKKIRWPMAGVPNWAAYIAVPATYGPSLASMKPGEPIGCQNVFQNFLAALSGCDIATATVWPRVPAVKPMLMPLALLKAGTTGESTGGDAVAGGVLGRGCSMFSSVAPIRTNICWPVSVIVWPSASVMGWRAAKLSHAAWSASDNAA